MYVVQTGRKLVDNALLLSSAQRNLGARLDDRQRGPWQPAAVRRESGPPGDGSRL